MDLQLQQQHILITGGSRGIGLACAAGFLAEGARVTLVGRSPQHLAEARANLLAQHPGREADIRCHSADVTDAQAAQQMVSAVQSGADALGPVDVLVNCAGAAKRTPAGELTADIWHAALQAKFFAYIHVIDPLIKQMAARRKGVVINVVGMGGKVPSPVHLPGGSANAALMLASAGYAAAYVGQGVRVNAVNPSTTHTTRMDEGLKAEARAAGITPQEALDRINRKHPMGRVAEPEEMAHAVVFLASAKASYINGAVLCVDGGLNPMVV